MSSSLAAYSELGAADIVALIRARQVSCVEVAAAANIAIARLDGPIHAFAAEAGDHAIDRARELDRLAPESAAYLPLLGVPVAVKDVFDTVELPTEYGSPIYRGHRPRADAALVALLRAAGAVIVGKTRTSEFACMHPSDTRNPLDLERTPGGSSSGSAAAVAAGMVPLATGTQTAGSIVRPASYCGVLGFKPTFGVVPMAGALPVSGSLDTAGLFARNLDDLELALDAICAAPPGMASARAARSLDGAGEPLGGADARRSPRIGVVRMAWELLEPAARNAIETYLDAASGAGATLEEVELPVAFERLVDAQLTIQLAETAWALGREADWHGELVSAALRSYIDQGRAVTRSDYLAARRLADEQRWPWHERLGDLDAVVAPSTLGVPPLTLDSTGDPLLCRPFTLLGVPTLALPGAWTPSALPVGVQLAGTPHGDRSVLRVGRWLLERVGTRSPAAR